MDTKSKSSHPSDLPTAVSIHTGDLKELIARRTIRVLIPYSRTLFFIDKGKERGVTADIFRLFERYINTKYRKALKKRPVTVLLIPTKRDQLQQKIVSGQGDIAAGNFTVTDNRKKITDFYIAPNQKGIAELVITNKDAPEINTPFDLSGQSVFVREHTSYYDNLVKLNKMLAKKSRQPVKIVTLPDQLEDEDILELLDAGVFPITIADRWVANMWAKVLPNINVHQNVAIRSGDQTGWAIRKSSPGLKKHLDEFYKDWVIIQGHSTDRSWNYAKRVNRLKNPTKLASYQRFQSIFKIFEKYSKQYTFDPLLMVALGYQESKLDQNAKSHAGAVGIMQLLPSTGASMHVGNIYKTDANVHAGIKYMHKLMLDYFKDSDFDPFNRTLFALASYNAGPGNIKRMQKLAIKNNLNPNIWFGHVEMVTAQHIGLETTTYVRNIYKYYVAYRLMQDRAIDTQTTQKNYLNILDPIDPLVPRHQQ